MAEENRRLTGKLKLRGIALELILGVHPFERIEKRTVPVDIVRTGLLFQGSVPAVDYTEICRLLKNELRNDYLYIEELAADILSLLKKSFSGSWKVTVRKPEPPLELSVSEASVTVED